MRILFCFISSGELPVIGRYCLTFGHNPHSITLQLCGVFRSVCLLLFTSEVHCHYIDRLHALWWSPRTKVKTTKRPIWGRPWVNWQIHSPN